MTIAAVCGALFLGLVAVLQIVLLLRSRRSGVDEVAALRQVVEQVDRSVRAEVALNRQEQAAQSQALRTEIGATLRAAQAGADEKQNQLYALVDGKLTGMGQQTTAQLGEMRLAIATEVAGLRKAVDERLMQIQAGNETKLEQMRQTVDEKLQGTLEAKLGDSFKQVSDRLEQVYKGLGEMQSLAAGVGDLKRVLTNVKLRGTWGEVQLGALLEQILTPDQYAENVATTGTSERVEFAIRLPGREAGSGPVWLPIDAKFPVEDYQRVIEASEQGRQEAVEQAVKELEATIKLCARNLSQKYLAPPATTDFGILFLSTEGLYAEAMRRPGLAEQIQREHRVVLAGPSTLAAMLNTFQMGFRTLAIQQRSSEVWELLGAVKTEFGKYAGVLEKVKRKLAEAQNTVESAETRTRAIQRKLRGVEAADGRLVEGGGLEMVEEAEDSPDAQAAHA
ncbi:MAG: DNA recombination protein RmuC [Bryobacteraceae bacterium]